MKQVVIVEVYNLLLSYTFVISRQHVEAHTIIDNHTITTKTFLTLKRLYVGTNYGTEKINLVNLKPLDNT